MVFVVNFYCIRQFQNVYLINHRHANEMRLCLVRFLVSLVSCYCTLSAKIMYLVVFYLITYLKWYSVCAILHIKVSILILWCTAVCAVLQNNLMMSYRIIVESSISSELDPCYGENTDIAPAASILTVLFGSNESP